MTALCKESVRIRRATSHDSDTIAILVAEHAEYERNRARPDRGALASALDAPRPRLLIWLAELDGDPLGYAAVTEDFSTWRAAPFLHLDCLYVRQPYRGRGVGADLFGKVQRHAKEQGIDVLEWQTPSWNEDAIRFYQRMGGRYDIKARFSLSL